MKNTVMETTAYMTDELILTFFQSGPPEDPEDDREDDEDDDIFPDREDLEDDDYDLNHDDDDDFSLNIDDDEELN